MESRATHNGTERRRATPVTFRAKPSGLIGSTLVLEDDRAAFGTMTLTSPGEVVLEDSSLTGTVEKRIPGYRLTLGEVEVTATRRSGVYELRSGDSVYEARLAPMKNSAKATPADGRRIEVRGGLLSRDYEVFCDGGFEASVLLLYMTASLRRRAFTV